MTDAAQSETYRQTSRTGRPRESFVRARRHSRRVGFLKIGLPVAAVLLIAVFAGWAWLSKPAGFTTDIVGSAVREGKLVMANPKLNGFTKDNLPYTMSAERAVQDLSETSRIVLESISARLPVDPGRWADIVADRGVFDNERNTLDIETPMTIKTTDGLVANLESAHVDIASGAVTTGSPVTVEMQNSSLKADSMAVTDNGKAIVFEKRVRMTILPNAVPARRTDED